MTKKKTGSLASGVALTVCALSTVLVFAGPLASTAVADEPALDEIEREIEKAAASYLDEESYQIRFSQENYWALADSSFATGAVLTARPPYSLSIRYDDGGRIVAFGGTLRVYIPQTEQFFVSSIDSTGLTVDPASILRSYHLHPSEPLISCDASRLVVRLVPENRFMDPSSVEVTIDRVNHLVVRLAAQASSGDRSTYIIENTTLGLLIPENEFRLTPPPGVSIQGGSPYDYGDVGS